MLRSITFFVPVHASTKYNEGPFACVWQEMIFANLQKDIDGVAVINKRPRWPRTADDCRTLNKQPLLHWHPMKLYLQGLVGVKGSEKLETIMERKEAVEMPWSVQMLVEALDRFHNAQLREKEQNWIRWGEHLFEQYDSWISTWGYRIDDVWYFCMCIRQILLQIAWKCDCETPGDYINNEHQKQHGVTQRYSR